MKTLFSKKEVEGRNCEMVSEYRLEGCNLYKYSKEHNAYLFHWASVSLSKKGVDYFAESVERIEHDESINNNF